MAFIRTEPQQIEYPYKGYFFSDCGRLLFSPHALSARSRTAAATWRALAAPFF
jgi:hypothetical protein